MECIFKDIETIYCKKSLDPDLSDIRVGGLRTILSSSRKRKDSLHLSLITPQDDANPRDATVYKCHKSCKSTYTSDLHIKRLLSTMSETHQVEPMPLRSRDEAQFKWKEQCFLCAEDCFIDKRHKDRRKVVECHTSDRGSQKTFKEAILNQCDLRNDTWSNEVRIRLSDSRCLYDLHTADARYHLDCKLRFMTLKKKKDSPSAERDDEILTKVVEMIKQRSDRMCTSVDLFETCSSLGGSLYSRRQLVKRIMTHSGDELVRLQSRGLADIFIIRSHASSVIQMQSNENQDDDSTQDMVEVIASKVISEIKLMVYDKRVYHKTY